MDRDASAPDALCGGFLSWRTVEQLRLLGVDCPALGAPRIERLAIHGAQWETVLDLPAPAFALSRRALDNALRERAQAAGVRIEVDTIRQLDGTKATGQREYRDGDGLFLATGKHDLRGATRPRTAADPALGMRLRLPPAPYRQSLLAGKIELHLFKGGYAGIVLQEDGSANICMAMRKSVFARAGGEPAAMLAMLADRNPAFAARIGSGWSALPCDSIGAVPYGWIARDTAPGVYRLGDQAAVIPSLAGEGIAIALASGMHAADHWLRRGADGAREYQRRFAALATPPVAAARTARQAAEHPQLARAALAFASRVPPLARWLMAATRIPAPPSLAPVRPAP